MRTPSHGRTGELGFNMTPMIDVVFLLIIFFLVSSHLAQREAQMQLPLPEAESGVNLAPTVPRRLTLNVLADGSLLLAGRRITLTELPQRLAEVRAATGPELEVRIRGDRHVPYQHISPLLLACTRAGIGNVSIGVYRPEKR
jgi:biopolymer transport protein ExbD